MKKLTLLTGASGAVGPLVVKAFHDAGFPIRTLSIDQPPPGMWPENVETHIGDVTDEAAVRAAMEGVESVVHMAALLHIVNPPPALVEKYERINVGGTATIVDAAIQAGVRRLVLFSTISVYGPSDGRVLDETSPTRPDTSYARTKLAAERIVLNAMGADGQPLGTVLRLGAVYGKRVKGNYQRLVRALARGRFVPLGDGTNRRTLIYDKDVSRAAVLAAGHASAAGKIFNVSDGRFHSMNEIIGTICAALGRKPPGYSLPVSPVRRLAAVLEEGARLFGRQSPVTRSSIDKYTEDLAVDSRRIQLELGFTPQFDLKAGWEETIRDMQA